MSAMMTPHELEQLIGNITAIQEFLVDQYRLQHLPPQELTNQLKVQSEHVVCSMNKGITSQQAMGLASLVSQGPWTQEQKQMLSATICNRIVINPDAHKANAEASTPNQEFYHFNKCIRKVDKDIICDETRSLVAITDYVQLWMHFTRSTSPLTCYFFAPRGERTGSGLL